MPCPIPLTAKESLFPLREDTHYWLSCRTKISSHSVNGSSLFPLDLTPWKEDSFREMYDYFSASLILLK